MKTEDFKIQKLVAEEGKIIVSKATTELFGIEVPESYGKEIFLGIQAKKSDFKEMKIETFNELMLRVDEARKEAESRQQEAEQNTVNDEIPTEFEEHFSDGSSNDINVESEPEISNLDSQSLVEEPEEEVESSEIFSEIPTEPAEDTPIEEEPEDDHS